MEFDEVQLLRYQPGDVLVFKFPHAISQDRWSRMRKHISNLLPDVAVKAIILENGVELEVLREEDS